MAPEPLLARMLRFGRAIVVGGGATLADVCVLTTCIRVVGLAPTTARIPGLLAGSLVQFFGNRSFTFRAQKGNLGRQAWTFIISQGIAIALNYTLFRALMLHVAKGYDIPPEIVSFAGTFVVFVAFEYPVRKLVVFPVPRE